MSSNKIIKTQNIDVSIINSIRRVLISNIPVVGFIGEGEDCTVQITKNETIHSNEFLTHRICMFPIHLSIDEAKAYDDNSLVAKLDISNKTMNIIDVTSKDIQFFLNGTALSEKRKDELINPFIYNNKKHYHLIAHLKPGKSIAFSASAVTRTGSYHSSFSPVAGIRHYFDYDTTDTTKDPVEREMSYYKNKDKGTPKTILLAFDIINGYSYEGIMNKAFDVLISKIDNMSESLTTNNSEKVESVRRIHENSYMFKFKDENHTTGNVLQTYTHNTYVLDKKNSAINGKRCLYMGYQCPDPMVNILELMITLEDTDDELVFREFFKKICAEVIDDLKTYSGKWSLID